MAGGQTDLDAKDGLAHISAWMEGLKDQTLLEQPTRGPLGGQWSQVVTW